ncbi:MAG: hypothetical protein ACLFU8_17065 [Anaerolineales bacterium]
MRIKSVRADLVMTGGVRAFAPLVVNVDLPPGAETLLIGAIVLMGLMTLLVLLLMLLSSDDTDERPTRQVDARREDVEKVIDRIRDL